MIRVSVNGENHNVPDKTTMSELLDVLRINNRYCAVEQNQEVVPREHHPNTLLSDGDTLEIVTLVGGG
ncbi:MAG: sulfur carrier protein ThiS [Fuerstiella sp.]|nr:sulfur carrier protein ThiS [Fuerstiella sp.]